MFEYYIINIYTGEETFINGYDFESACFDFNIDPDSVEILDETFIG